MVFELLSAVFRRESTGMPHVVAPDEETRRISVALLHIQAHGNLDRLAASWREKQALFATVSRRQLVTWRRKRRRYELTKAGQRFAAHGTTIQGVPGEIAQGLSPPRSIMKFGMVIGALVGVAALMVLTGLPVPEPIQAGASDSPAAHNSGCLLYTSPSPRDRQKSRMPSSA